MNPQQIYQKMHDKLQHIVPPAELALKAELVHEIEQLKKERNAIVLGHNYMEPALFHTIPDIQGDSLELARKSTETDADVIVVCGVEFMAETTKILNPQKTVLVPSNKAGCSLASSITAEQVRKLKKQFPGAPVVSYVNTYADVKAETDICCTSSNAAKIVANLDSEKIIFLPDQFLAQNVARDTGKTLIVPTEDQIKEIDTNGVQLIGWPGKCEVHERFSVDDITNARKQSPGVIVLAHPECPAEVCEAADFTGSTSAMIRYVEERKSETFLLLTECSMADNILAENPESEMLRLCNLRCPHMAQITLEMTRDALLYNQYEIKLDADVIEKARASLINMLELS